MNRRVLDLLIKTLLWVSIAAPLNLVRAQTTNATCLPDWAWSSNSKQQSPCLVAAYLLAPCANGQWNVPALQQDQYYLPPTQATANQCTCSTVAYQLMQACGSCQGQAIVRWSSWRMACSDGVISISSYPRPITSATAVPAWAYLDVITGDIFNATIARAVNLPESSSVGSTSSTHPSTSSPPTTSSPTTSPPSSSTSSAPPDTPSNSNIGPIVGGAVGGVIGLGLIICLAIFLVKRKSTSSKRMPPSAEFSKVIPPGSPVPANFDPARVGFRSRTASPMSNGLSSDYGHGAPNMQNIGMMGAQHNAGGMGYGGSPWSPPPVGHTPAPSAEAYSSAYTPPPMGMGNSPRYAYTPPPGTIASTPSIQHYAHSHSNSVVTGYNPTPVHYQNMPYGGHASNSSYTHGSSGAPEL